MHQDIIKHKKVKINNAETRHYLCHDNVLTLFDELILCFDNSLQKLEVLNITAVCFDAVDEVLNHTLIDLTAQLEVVHEDVLHGYGF